MMIINTMGIGDGGIVAIVTMMTVIRYRRYEHRRSDGNGYLWRPAPDR